MSEIQATPEPLERPDFDTLGDQAYDREVEEALWKPRLLRIPCGYCSTLGCPACVGRGFTVAEEPTK